MLINNIDSIEESPAIIAVIDIISEIQIAIFIAFCKGFGIDSFLSDEKYITPNAKTMQKSTIKI